jgi:hypothetical protein
MLLKYMDRRFVIRKVVGRDFMWVTKWDMWDFLGIGNFKGPRSLSRKGALNMNGHWYDGAGQDVHPTVDEVMRSLYWWKWLLISPITEDGWIKIPLTWRADWKWNSPGGGG